MPVCIRNGQSGFEVGIMLIDFLLWEPDSKTNWLVTCDYSRSLSLFTYPTLGFTAWDCITNKIFKLNKSQNTSLDISDLQVNTDKSKSLEFWRSSGKPGQKPRFGVFLTFLLEEGILFISTHIRQEVTESFLTTNTSVFTQGITVFSWISQRNVLMLFF